MQTNLSLGASPEDIDVLTTLALCWRLRYFLLAGTLLGLFSYVLAKDALGSGLGL